MSDASVALGQRLSAERVRKGLSCQKAADELHLDGWVIEGLESGDYARIGPSVYAKGHLKRYAELLGLPVNEVLESFEAQPAADAPSLQTTLRLHTLPSAGSKVPWLPIATAFLVVALLVAGIWAWHPWRPRAPGVPQSAGTVVTPPVAPHPVAAPPAVAAALVAPPVPVAPASVPAASAAPVPTVAVPAVPDPPGMGAGRARLRLLFLGDSWVDVRDAAGQRLYAGNGRLNNVRSMSGTGPLRVYIKAASNVHVDLNNHMVAIGPQFIVDNVAHFQAGADGVLRSDPQAARPRG